ncbi:MAG: FAD-dependent oxidoreductase, partial [Armatimonadetes bacterium]|nr:FAD-dependent oxidoreductase [Armatimonadota bacterium]
MKPTALVIGAGISGLTAAYRLARAGWHVEVIEERDEIGGLARSMSLGSGRIERYYHFICRGDAHLLRLARELDLSESLR